MQINYLETTRLINGTSLKVSNLQGLKKLADGKDKKNLPAAYVYSGVKGTYSPTNLFFIDIDTTEGVDQILLEADKLFSSVKNLVFLQKSYSGKLHIGGIFPTSAADEKEWSENARLYTAVTLHFINKIFGIDYYNAVNSDNNRAFDAHSLKYSQALYMSANPILENPYPIGIALDKTTTDHIKELYPEIFPAKKSTVERKDPNIYASSMPSFEIPDRIRVDKNLNIGRYSGNTLRVQICAALTEVYKELAKDVADKYFYFDDGKSIYTGTLENYLTYKVSYVVKNWLLTKGIIKVRKNETSLECIAYDLQPGEYISSDSSRIDEISGLISTSGKQLFCIKAPTGAGKTTMIEHLVDRLGRSTVIVPFNIMRALYEWKDTIISFFGDTATAAKSHIITPSDKNIDAKHTNIAVWDQAVKRIESLMLVSDYFFIDESHLLFFDRDFRESAAKLLDMVYTTLSKNNKKVIFVTATPAGELTKNCQLIEFKRKEQRKLSFHIVRTNYPLTYLTGFSRTATKKYDYICYFTDYYARKLYAEMEYTSTLFHSVMNNNIRKIQENKDFRLITPKNIFTQIAYNGVNFVNDYSSIAVLIVWDPSSTTHQIMEQIIGRFRGANNDLDIYLVVATSDIAEHDDKLTLDDQIEYARIIKNEGLSLLETENLRKLSDDSFAKIVKEIDLYVKEHASLPALISKMQDLSNNGTVDQKSKIYDKKDYKNMNRFRRRASFEKSLEIYNDYEREDLVEEVKNSDEYKDLIDIDATDELYVAEYKAIEDRINSYHDKGRSIYEAMIIDYMRRSNRPTLQTLLSSAEMYSRLMTLTWEEIEKEEDDINNLIANKTLGNKLDKIALSRIKRMSKQYEKFLDLKERHPEIENPSDVTDELIYGFIDDVFNQEVELKAEGGKITGKKNGKGIVDAEGNIYVSLQEYASAKGISLTAAKNHLKKGKIRRD